MHSNSRHQVLAHQDSRYSIATYPEDLLLVCLETQDRCSKSASLHQAQQGCCQGTSLLCLMQTCGLGTSVLSFKANQKQIFRISCNTISRILMSQHLMARV